MAASGLDARATAQPNARAAELSPSVSLVARSSAPYLSPRRKPQGTAMTIEAQTPSAPPSNQLGGATSPYLLQHAGNPVHWREWGEAALAEARATGKPILLSVGYATCHWCHVMAHESFEDEQTAALMNRLFVSIKVDREERPDIDHLYMSALHLLGEQGGWPLTMFLTSEGDPFWGGTYFPPEPRWGRPSFRQVLQAVADGYERGHEMVGRNTEALRAALVRMSATRPGEGIGPPQLDAAAAALLRSTDPEHGGLRGAPKFPNPPIFRFLLQNDFRTGGQDGRTALHLLLEHMSQGGIYDHLGGGYARYSTDAIWLVPHFEKMLYDNAQLLELLAFAHADRPSPLYAERAEETVGWLLRDMRATKGAKAAFASSEDADSEGEEGRFYVWTADEVDAALSEAGLGAVAAAFKRAYDVTPGGNWDERIILRRVTPRGAPDEEAALARARAALLAARDRRVRPGRDGKVLADWNGLTVAALVRAGAVFDRSDWLAAAEAAFDFVIARLGTADGRIDHAWREDRIGAAGLLDDQASLARAALALSEATGSPARLAQATRLVEAAEAHFSDSEGAFFTTADDAADVPLGPSARPRTAGDNVTPSGNALMAEVYARLHHLTGDATWRGKAEHVLRAFAGYGEGLSAMPTLLAAADLLAEGATVVIAGEGARALLSAALAAPDPAVIVLRTDGGLPASHPAHGKGPVHGVAAAYVCRRETCSLPVTDPRALAAVLRSRR